MEKLLLLYSRLSQVDCIDKANLVDFANMWKLFGITSAATEQVQGVWKNALKLSKQDGLGR